MPDQNKIIGLDKTIAGEIADRLHTAMEVAAKEMGIVIRRGSGRFDPATGVFNMKTVVQVDVADGKLPEEIEFERNQWRHRGWEIGTQFRCNGTTYSLIGFKPRARKNQYIATSPKGKRYVFPYEAVSKGLI